MGIRDNLELVNKRIGRPPRLRQEKGGYKAGGGYQDGGSENIREAADLG